MINYTSVKRDWAGEGFKASVPPQSPILASSSNCHRQNQWTQVPSRQGQYGPFSEDDHHGFNCNQSDEFLTREKMCFSTSGKRCFREDENSSFHFDGRYKTSRELMGFSLDSGYQQKFRKLQNWSSVEGSIFPPGRHDILSGKAVVQMPSNNHFHRLYDSKGCWDREQTKKVGRVDFELYGKTGRDSVFSGKPVVQMPLHHFHRLYDSEGSWDREQRKKVDTGDLELYGRTGKADSLTGKPVGQMPFHHFHRFYDSEGSWDREQRKKIDNREELYSKTGRDDTFRGKPVLQMPLRHFSHLYDPEGLWDQEQTRKAGRGDLEMYSQTGRDDILSGKPVVQIPLHHYHRPYDSEGSWNGEQTKKVGSRDLELYSNTGKEFSCRNENKFDVHKRASELDSGRPGQKDFGSRHDRYGTLGNKDSLTGGSQNIPEEKLLSTLDSNPRAWGQSTNLSSWSSISDHAISSDELISRQLLNAGDVFSTKSPHKSPLKSTFAGISGPDDEFHHQKKPRLGWGQGLAKYENQKVDSICDNNDTSYFVQSMTSAPHNVEGVSHVGEVDIEARSPQAPAATSECRSPEYLYPVTSISSPDEHLSPLGAGSSESCLYGKPCNKIPIAVEHGNHHTDASLLAECTLPVYRSQIIDTESSLDSEPLVGNTFAPRNSEAVDALQMEVPSIGLSCAERAGSTVTLLLLKNDILQKLERIEYEFDTVEKELVSLNSEIGGEDCIFEGKDYLDTSGDCSPEACTEVDEGSIGERWPKALAKGGNGGIVVPLLDADAPELRNAHKPITEQPIDFQVRESQGFTYTKGDEGSFGERCPKALAGDVDGGIEAPLWDKKAAEAKNSNEPSTEEPIESQLAGTEDSTAVMQAVGRQRSEEVESDDVKDVAANVEAQTVESQSIMDEDPTLSSCIETNAGITIQSSSMMGGPVQFTSLASNTEPAKKDSEIFSKLLPTVWNDVNQLSFSEISEMPVWKQNSLIHEKNRKLMEEKIIEQRHFANFKEQALAYKFRVLREWWVEEQTILSSRKSRGRAQKRSQKDRFLSIGNQSCRLSFRSRFSSPAASLTFLPASEADQLRRLASDVQGSPYRGNLKMPAMILHDKERHFSKFLTSNRLVEDPVALEKERTMINPWTSKEREIYWQNFAIFGKNFSRIASFLEHKTVADCVEFYYKNHKSVSYERLKIHKDLQKQRAYSCTSMYLSTSGNKRHRDSDAISLDILGAAVALATSATDQRNCVEGASQKYSGRPSGTPVVFGRMPYDGVMKSKNGRAFDAGYMDTERECIAAADVLAGICGASSSEAMGSCISSAVDPSEGFHEKSCFRLTMKKNDEMDQPLTSKADFEACNSAEESCEDITADWTDNEKWLFIAALNMFAMDFESISAHVRSKTEDQCRSFFCKARKRLKLDELIQQGSVVAAKRKFGSDYDAGLTEMHTNNMLLCSVGASCKTIETSKSEVLDAAEENARAEMVLNEAGEVCLGNETLIEGGKAWLSQQIELNQHTRQIELNQHTPCEPVSHSPLNKVSFCKGTSLNEPSSDNRLLLREDSPSPQNERSCMVLNEREAVSNRNEDTLEEASCQPLAQVAINSQTKIQQQQQVLWQNSQQILQMLEDVDKQHQESITQLFPQENHLPTLPSSNQGERSLQALQQCQLFNQCQQHHSEKLAAYNSVCENNFCPPKAGCHDVQHEHEKLKQRTKVKSYSTVKVKPNCKQQTRQLQPRFPLQVGVKPCSRSHECVLKTGDAKRFGQTLISQTSNVSKPLEWQDDVLPCSQGDQVSDQELDTCSEQKTIPCLAEDITCKAQGFAEQNLLTCRGDSMHDDCGSSMPHQPEQETLSREPKSVHCKIRQDLSAAAQGQLG